MKGKVPEKTKPRRAGQGFDEQRHNHQEMNVMQNSTTVIDLRQFIEAKGGKPFTSSLNVAKAFDKQHHHVMQKLDSLDCSEQFLTRNFSRVQFWHRGNQYDACEMTKDGFMFLVMGFTGKKAAAIKEGYIAAFNWMAEQIGSSGGEQVDNILNSTIGTDGFHCLAAVLDGKVRHLPAPFRKRAKQHVWSQVHKAFSVVSAEDIPASSLDAARNFIAAYAIEGEWMPKEEARRAGIAEWSNIGCLIHCLEQTYAIFERYRLYHHLGGLGCQAGAEMLGFLWDGLGSAAHVKKHCATELASVSLGRAAA